MDEKCQKLSPILKTGHFESFHLSSALCFFQNHIFLTISLMIRPNDGKIGKDCA